VVIARYRSWRKRDSSCDEKPDLRSANVVVDHDNDHKFVEKKDRMILSVKCGIKFLHKGGTKEKEERDYYVLPKCLSNSIPCSPPQTTESRTLFANTDL
jgi:hypothetical protein